MIPNSHAYLTSQRAYSPMINAFNRTRSTPHLFISQHILAVPPHLFVLAVDVLDPLSLPSSLFLFHLCSPSTTLHIPCTRPNDAVDYERVTSEGGDHTIWPLVCRKQTRDYKSRSLSDGKKWTSFLGLRGERRTPRATSRPLNPGPA